MENFVEQKKDMTEHPKFYPTVVHMLQQAVIEFGDALAIKYEDRQLSYIQYLRCVAGLSRRFQTFNNGQTLIGERIAFICGNSIEMAVGLFAGHASGAQVVPINPIYKLRELSHISENLYFSGQKQAIRPENLSPGRFLTCRTRC